MATCEIESRSPRLLAAATAHSSGLAASKAGAVASRPPGGGGGGPSTATSDGTPLQISLRDERDELVGSLAADIDGLDALRTLAADKSAAEALSEARLQDELRQAACRGDVDALSRCVARGADVKRPDAWGQSALHWASSAPPLEGAAPAVEYCLRSGAAPTAQNIVGMTPLHWASAWGRLPAARALLGSGASREALNVQKKAPASMAHVIPDRLDARGAIASKLDGFNARGKDGRFEGKLAMLRELLGPREAAARHIQAKTRTRRVTREAVDHHPSRAGARRQETEPAASAPPPTRIASHQLEDVDERYDEGLAPPAAAPVDRRSA